MARTDEVMIIGSQSILGAVPDAPPGLTGSREADVYPLHNPAAAEHIDGAIGEDSVFDTTYGFYAHGVGPETATFADGWEARRVAVYGPATRGATGWCPEPHDLAASKLFAGREDKDLPFVQAMLHHQLIRPSTLHTRIHQMPVAVAERMRMKQHLGRMLRALRPERAPERERGRGGLNR